MSGKRVKALRATIYGDMSAQSEYQIDKNTGTIYANTLRQRYQMAKGRKENLPKMGRIRIVAKRPKVVKSRLKGEKGAFGEVNRLASIQLDMRSKRKKERDARP